MADNSWIQRFGEYNAGVPQIASYTEIQSFPEVGAKTDGPAAKSSGPSININQLMVSAVAVVAMVVVVAPVLLTDVGVSDFDYSVTPWSIDYSFEFTGMTPETTLDISLHNATYSRTSTVTGKASFTGSEDNLSPGMSYTLSVYDGVAVVFERTIRTPSAGMQVTLAEYNYSTHEIDFKANLRDADNKYSDFSIEFTSSEYPEMESVVLQFSGDPTDSQSFDTTRLSDVPPVSLCYRVLCQEAGRGQVELASGYVSPYVQATVTLARPSMDMTVHLTVHDPNNRLLEMNMVVANVWQPLPLFSTEVYTNIADFVTDPYNIEYVISGAIRDVPYESFEYYGVITPTYYLSSEPAFTEHLAYSGDVDHYTLDFGLYVDDPDSYFRDVRAVFNGKVYPVDMSVEYHSIDLGIDVASEDMDMGVRIICNDPYGNEVVFYDGQAVFEGDETTPTASVSSVSLDRSTSKLTVDMFVSDTYDSFSNFQVALSASGYEVMAFDIQDEAATSFDIDVSYMFPDGTIPYDIRYAVTCDVSEGGETRSIRLDEGMIEPFVEIRGISIDGQTMTIDWTVSDTGGDLAGLKATISYQGADAIQTVDVTLDPTQSSYEVTGMDGSPISVSVMLDDTELYEVDLTR